ncbi:FtsX-like permease family protein [Actinomadura gamaensis]|uniref:FtsX-like permease family protein n=1 Tax=Actinomadura gamaensis TaxID=1763541 RepID=A0ABV9U927_9ACTN
MVSRVLAAKLRRDVWRRRWQFAAVAVVIALGVCVFVAASDAYRDLGGSFDRAYADQRLPDAVVSGPGAAALATAASALPGRPAVTVRHQAETGLRVAGHTLLGRTVGVPEAAQPDVSRLVLRSGRLPGRDEVLVEQHLADHFHVRPGQRIQVLGPAGWRSLAVAGTGLSTEYFWPARSSQEVMTTPEHFGVLFAPEATVASLGPHATEQLALYARDRGRTAALTASVRALATARGLTVVDRRDQPSFHALDEDVKSIGEFATLLPWLFLAAAVVGTYVLLSRLVAAQRAVIGTLAANGLAPGALRRHYLAYGLVAGAAGILPGLAGGYLLGDWFTTRYTAALGLPLHVTALHIDVLLAGALAALATAALAAWAPARAAVRIAPAEAMRIAPPSARGRRSLVERALPPLLRVRWRMVVRGVSRNRKRAWLTVAGVTASLSLVLVFAGLRDTVAGVIDRQYGTVQRENAQVDAAPGAASTVLSAVRSDPAVAAAEPYARQDVVLTAGTRRSDTLLFALPADTAMHRFRGTSGDVRLPDHGVLLARGLRDTLHLRVGQPVTLTLAQSGRRLTEPVAGFVDEPMSAVAYTSLGHLGASSATGVLLRLRPGADPEAAQRRVSALPGVEAYLDTGRLADSMRKAFELYNTLVGIMLAFAALMAAALLFNAMSANVAERAVELGTLRAAGMTPGMLARLVAAENLALVVLGVPFGLLTGTLLARWLMTTYQTQGYHWALDMRPSTPVYVTLGILLAALIAQAPVLRTLRRIDIARIVRERSL